MNPGGQQEQLDPSFVIQALSEQREQANNMAATHAARAAAFQQELKVARERIVELEERLAELEAPEEPELPEDPKPKPAPKPARKRK